MNNLLTVEASLSPVRQPDGVADNHITSGGGNEKHRENQEEILEKRITNDILPQDSRETPASSIMSSNSDSQAVKEWNASSKFKGKKWHQDSQGEEQIENEKTGKRGFNLKIPDYENSGQERGQEMEAEGLEESSIIGLRDDNHQRLIAGSELDQGGSRRRRKNGSIIPTSTLDISEDPGPPSSGYVYLWERFVRWLYSFWARLLGSGRQ